VVVALDGLAAWDLVRTDPTPSLAIVDWMMPGIDGPELCRRVRQDPSRAGLYIILLTGRTSRADIVAGLDAGAGRLPGQAVRARGAPGAGTGWHARRDAAGDAGARVTELQTALANVKELKGLIPICAYCKRVRTDGNYWERVESYVGARTAAEFSHGICPSCLVNVEKEIDKHAAHVH